MARNTYYKVCPVCGLNLDPGERCECKKCTDDPCVSTADANILFLCDRRRCQVCHSDCRHTTDIKHAVNFTRDEAGLMIEVSFDLKTFPDEVEEGCKKV